MKKVLILVDNSRRDLLPCMLLKFEFEVRGYKVKFCNKRNYTYVFMNFTPDAFIVTRGDYPFIKDFSRSCRIFLVPAEGARLTPETMKSVFIGRMHKGEQYDQSGNIINDFNFIDMVYLWGDLTHRYLASNGLIKPERLKVVGNGRLDVYRHKLIPLKRVDADFTLGLAFSIKSISSCFGNVNFLETIFGFFDKAKSMNFPMVPKGRHYEDYVWRDFAIARKMLELIINIIHKTNLNIKIRIGPFENPKDYKFLEEKFPGRITIQNVNQQLVDFLSQIDTLLTCWSTTGLESVLMNKPVISIAHLIDKNHLLSHVDATANGFDTFLKIYYTPVSIDEALLLIAKAKSKSLDLTPDAKFCQKFIKDVYAWPCHKSTTELIVSDVTNKLKDSSRAVDSLKSNSLSYNNRLRNLSSMLPVNNYILTKCILFYKNIKFLFIDFKNGTFKSSRMHYELRNSAVKNLSLRTYKFLKKS